MVLRTRRHRGEAKEMGSHAAPPRNPAPPPPKSIRKCSPEPQRLPNRKLDFIAQDLADLWTQKGQRQPGWEGHTEATHTPHLPPLDTRAYRKPKMLQVQRLRKQARGGLPDRGGGAWLQH